jgi:hypothetical protein
MTVRGGFIGEFGATIIAFVFPRRAAASASASAASASSASAASLFITRAIVIFVFHHQCHPFHVP